MHAYRILEYSVRISETQLLYFNKSLEVRWYFHHEFRSSITFTAEGSILQPLDRLRLSTFNSDSDFDDIMKILEIADNEKRKQKVRSTDSRKYKENVD